MSNILLGKLEEITDLRSVWKDEARDFTPWLAQNENIDILGQTLGIDINVESTESAVGDFSADIYATVSNSDEGIIIENQLEQSNHDHLGKILTYASGKNASYVIWIVKKAREEHKAAISWLNEHTDEKIGFFLVEIKLYKIGDSQLAPQFVPVSIPNNWAKQTKSSNSSNNKDLERHLVRLNYWTSLNDSWDLNPEFAKSFKKRKPSRDYWYTLSIGTSEAVMSLLKLNIRNSIGIEFKIFDNKKLFDIIYSHKKDIEEETGLTFDWDRNDDRLKSSISIEKKADLDNEKDWPNQFLWFMETALKMKKSFLKYLFE
ncbi:DUF4268 domain-containing protein [Succinivibrio dextrinosolvens]|jgi:hypothetical protein|uniref:DUF4268 domain-containing protein n=1 Tax=Succinivibrio dextrinosolvens TaxID=83771 RepID=UPI00241C124C|nr:DUF4268 domain-containing protein [Succinivibrio dextrinosolvens]MBE6423047.1 DUF4268 domain-containing protein [Succinivibrio dextrinosolvens]